MKPQLWIPEFISCFTRIKQTLKNMLQLLILIRCLTFNYDDFAAIYSWFIFFLHNHLKSVSDPLMTHTRSKKKKVFRASGLIFILSFRLWNDYNFPSMPGIWITTHTQQLFFIPQAVCWRFLFSCWLLSGTQKYNILSSGNDCTFIHNANPVLYYMGQFKL